VTESTRSGNVPESYRSRWFRAEIRIVLIVAVILVGLGTLIGGHLYGSYLAALDLGGHDNVIRQLTAQNQQQKRKIDEQSAQLTSLQAKLQTAQATLQTIMPTANTYNIVPNQTLIVSDGRLMVGLIGSPGNEGITLNINGKQQTVTAGQVVTIAADQSTNCQVTVQSFDMFKAVLNAACPGARGR
jgi:hypothetical protein